MGDNKQGQTHDHTKSNNKQDKGQHKDNKQNQTHDQAKNHNKQDKGHHKDNKKNDINSHKITTYPNGDKYQGELLDGHRHGFGRITYVNGETYQGIFKHNKF